MVSILLRYFDGTELALEGGCDASLLKIHYAPSIYLQNSI